MIKHPVEAYQSVQTDAERERVLMEQLPRFATSPAAFTTGCPVTCPSKISSMLVFSD